MPKPSLITDQAVPPRMLSYARTMRRNMTPAEQTLWTQLRANRLSGFHFRRQHVIGPYIVDFYCHHASLVIEIDGSSHMARVIDDEIRDHKLVEQGLRVLRFTNIEVEHELGRVVDAIFHACMNACMEEEESNSTEQSTL